MAEPTKVLIDLNAAHHVLNASKLRFDVTFVCYFFHSLSAKLGQGVQV